MVPRYIADKSALARLTRATVERRLTPLLLAGDVASCGIIDLELFYSARSHADLVQLRMDRRALPSVEIHQPDFDRAITVMDQIEADLREHRRNTPLGGVADHGHRHDGPTGASPS